MTGALRIGFIGAGGIAAKHVDALEKVGGAQIVAVVDLSPERAAWLTSRTGAVYATSVEEIVDRIDAAYVLTPPRSRVETIAALARAGVPVFCEKPLAADVDDARAIAEVVSVSGIPFMTGFMRRWHHPNVLLRERVRSGALGEVIHISRQRIGLLRQPPGNWRVSPGQLCGVTMESASHDIDLLRWIAGDIESAAGQVSRTRPDLPGFDETCAAVLRFAGGAAGMLQVSWQSHLARNALTVIGTAGTAVLEGPGLWASAALTVATGDGEQVERFPAEVGGEDGYDGQAADFLRLVRGERIDHPGVADGLATVLVSQRILDSSDRVAMRH